MGYVSVYLCLLQFLSSIFYSFHFIDLTPLQINLFLSIFTAIINENVFLIFFPNGFLLVYRNATDLCMLILCSANLLNVFINLNRFSCGVFRAFYICDYVTYKQGQFNFFLCDLCDFYFFLLPNSSGQVFYYYVEQTWQERASLSQKTPDLKGKAFRFSPLNMLAVSL